MSDFILPAGILIAAAIAAAGGAYWLKATKMTRRCARQAAELQRVLDRLTRVEIMHSLGVGNIGVVSAARLREGWRNELGIHWAADDAGGGSSGSENTGRIVSSTSLPPCDLTGPVALKLAIFGSPAKRLRTLCQLAPLILENWRSASPVPLCPFLALGLIVCPKSHGRYIVEVMPLIEGTSLRSALHSGALNNVPPAQILAQLRRVLDTVEFLESRRFFSRNLDEDNVIVQPDGTWMRIDFDNASRHNHRPHKTAHRLCRFLLRALDQLERSAAHHDVNLAGLSAARDTIQATLAALNKHGKRAPAHLTSLDEIVAAVKSLTAAE